MFAMNLESRLEVQLLSSIDMGMSTLSFKKKSRAAIKFPRSRRSYQLFLLTGRQVEDSKSQ